MSKYETNAGIELTKEECSLIDSLKRLEKKWKKDGGRLWLYATGTLFVMLKGDTDDNPHPEHLPDCGVNPDNIVTQMTGIGNDGGDW